MSKLKKSIKSEKMSGLNNYEEVSNQFQHIPIPFFVGNTRGEIVWLNRALEQLLTPAGFEVAKDFSISNFTWPDFVLKEIERLLHKQQTFPPIRACLASNLHKPIWVKIRGWRLGKRIRPTVFAAIAEDITEEVESEKRYFDLIEDLPVPTHIVGDEGRIVEVNTAELYMLGYTADEKNKLVGEKVSKFVSLGEKRSVDAAVRDKLSGALQIEKNSFYRNYRRSDGRTIPVRISDKYCTEIKSGKRRIISTLCDVSLSNEARIGLTRPNIPRTDLFKGLPVSAFEKSIKNGVHKFTWVNNEFSSKWSNVDFSSHDVTDDELFPGNIAAKYRRDDREVVRLGQCLQKIEDHPDRNGRIERVFVVKSPLIGGMQVSSSIQGIFFPARDIAEVQRALNERFSLEGVQDIGAAIFREIDGEIFYANEKLSKLCGCKDVDDLLQFIDDTGWRNILNDQVLYEREGLGRAIRKLFKRSGQTTWVRETRVEKTFTCGDGIYFEVVLEDIGELKESEGRYNQLLSSTNDIVYTHTLPGEGLNSIRFTSINRAGLVLTEYAESEFLSLGVEDLVVPDCLPIVESELEKKLLNPDSRRDSYEIIINTKFGKRLILEVDSFFRNDPTGEVVEVMGICQDRTRLYQLRRIRDAERSRLALLEEYSRREMAEDAARSLIESVVHRVKSDTMRAASSARVLRNNIIRVLAGEELSRAKFDELLEALTGSIDECHRHLVRAIMYVGNRKSVARRIEVNSLLSQLCKKELTDKSVSLELNLMDGRAEFLGDNDWLLDVLTGIIENSLYEIAKFCPREGLVRVETTCVLHEQNGSHRKFVEVRISDNGPGIPDHQIYEATLPGKSFKPDGVGNGIGLADAQKYTDRHAGYMILERSVDLKGLTVRFGFAQLDEYENIND